VAVLLEPDQPASAEMFASEHQKGRRHDGRRMGIGQEVKAATLWVQGKQQLVGSTGRAKVQQEIQLGELGEFLHAAVRQARTQLH
jgi:hypothetical protein